MRIFRSNEEPNNDKNQTVGNLSHSCWTLEALRNLKQRTLNWPFSFLGWALHDVSRVDLICMTMGLDYWPKRPHKWIRIWIMSIRIPNSYSLHFSSIFCSFEMNRIKSSLISTVSPLEKSVGLRLVHELRQLPHLEHRRDWWRSGRRPTLQSFGDSSLFVVFCRFRVASLEFPPCVGKFHAWKPAIWSKANSGSSRRSWWHKPI